MAPHDADLFRDQWVGSLRTEDHVRDGFIRDIQVPLPDALVLGWIHPFGGHLFSKNRRFTKQEVLVGIGLASSAVLGQLGMALSLDHGIPGFVVFQVAPGGGLFFVVLAGVLFFKERVSIYGVAGIVIGMAALGILTFA